MRALVFSGWSQKADALKSVLPEGAECFDYGAYPSLEACFDELRGKTADVVVGWSLGGQVALRALSEGIISAKRVILLSTHYQAVRVNEDDEGAPAEALAGLRAAYHSAPEEMLKQFYLTCAYGDSNQRNVTAAMLGGMTPAQDYHWLYWLDALVDFSCETLDFDKIPPATLIYGESDCIVPVSQGHRMAARLTDVRLHLLPGCAHAPHLHDPQRVREIIADPL